MVVTPTSNNKVRVCIDLSKQCIMRENHPLPAVDVSRKRVSGLTKTTVCVHVRQSMSTWKQTVFNTRHKAKPLPSGTEVFVKNLLRSEKSSRQHQHLCRVIEVKTPTSPIRSNHVHLTPLSNQQEKHERPTPIVNRVSEEEGSATPVSPILVTLPGLREL